MYIYWLTCNCWQINYFVIHVYKCYWTVETLSVLSFSFLKRWIILSWSSVLHVCPSTLNVFVTGMTRSCFASGPILAFSNRLHVRSSFPLQLSRSDNMARIWLTHFVFWICVLQLRFVKIEVFCDVAAGGGIIHPDSLLIPVPSALSVAARCNRSSLALFPPENRLDVELPSDDFFFECRECVSTLSDRLWECLAGFRLVSNLGVQTSFGLSMWSWMLFPFIVVFGITRFKYWLKGVKFLLVGFPRYCCEDNSREGESRTGAKLRFFPRSLTVIERSESPLISGVSFSLKSWNKGFWINATLLAQKRIVISYSIIDTKLFDCEIFLKVHVLWAI